MSEPANSSTEAWVQAGYRYAYSLAHNRQDAEDLVQEAWLRLTRRYGRVKNRAMLFTTIRNAFYDHCRRERVVSFAPLGDALEPAAPASDPAASIPYAEMEKMLATLRPPEREALYLHVVEGFTAKEIARQTKTPRNSVLSLIFRAREKLRAKWSGESMASTDQRQ